MAVFNIQLVFRTVCPLVWCFGLANSGVFHEQICLINKQHNLFMVVATAFSSDIVFIRTGCCQYGVFAVLVVQFELPRIGQFLVRNLYRIAQEQCFIEVQNCLDNTVAIVNRAEFCYNRVILIVIFAVVADVCTLLALIQMLDNRVQIA